MNDAGIGSFLRVVRSDVPTTKVVRHYIVRQAVKKNPSQKQEKKVGVVVKTAKDKFSYALGLNFGRNVKRHGVEVNVDLLVKGLVHGLNQAEPKLSAKELRAAMISYQKAYLETIKSFGAAYLARNKTRKGVVTTRSGLQYKIIKAGGNRPRRPTQSRYAIRAR